MLGQRGLRMRIRVVIGMVAVAMLAVAGCGGRSAGSGAPTSAQRTTTSAPAAGSKIKIGGVTATYHATANAGGLKKITIQIADNYFDPTVIHGRPGQQLVLDLENETRSVHTFTTANLSADIEVQPGSVAAGKVTLPQSGNLLFFCRINKDRGMAGVFNVSGPLDRPGPTVGSQTTS
jgi:plastocyanin